MRFQIDNTPLEGSWITGPTAAKLEKEAIDTGWKTGPDVDRRSSDRGWATGPIVKPVSQNLAYMIGGYFNGRYCDIEGQRGARYIHLALEDGRIEWYERCPDGKAYVWAMTSTPEGIDIRETQ